MSSVAVLDEQALRRQHALSREKLEGLAQKLRGVDSELDALSGEREQHRLLSDVCGGLERLGALGGGELFWAGFASGEESAHQLRLVRGRVEAFDKHVGEIEERRESLLQEIDQHQHGAWFLENEILEAQAEAKERNQEWLVEREVGQLPARSIVMPWMRIGEEDERFRKSLTLALLTSLFFAVWAPFIEIPLPEPEPAAEAPERLTRLIMEQRRQPPPTEAMIPEAPKQALAKETPAEQKAKPKEGPGVGPADGPGKGILAFREKISGFAENQTISRLGSQARISSPGAAAGVVQRSMLTTQAAGSSGGINLADLSRGVGGGGSGGGRQIEGVQIARVESTIGGGGGRGSASSVGGGGPPVGRTDEEIQIVFDRHKAALYRLYNRELRRDPTLKGQVVLRIRIEPDGSVTICELQATDMNARELVAQVIERVKGFDFGAKPVPPITILYPIDFLPAT